MRHHAYSQVVLLLAMCCSCTNIRDKKITEENKVKILEEASKKLTSNESRLLQGYLMREGIKNVFQGQEPNLGTGRTIRQMIEEQRKWVAEQKEEEEKQKILAAEVAAKEAEMRCLVRVALFEFSIRKNFVSDYAQVGYAYENASGKDIRAFEGDIVYNDVLGNKLEEVPLKVLKPLKAGEKASVTDDLPFMVYGGLRDKKLEDLKIEWKPKKVLFADDSKVEAVSLD